MAERITQQQSLALQQLLREKPMGYADMELATSMAARRLARWVKKHRADLHVSAWAPDKNGRLFVPVFAWGRRPDTPRPGRALTPAEQMRKTRAARGRAAAGAR